jgi:hypothetical protein
MSDVIEIQRLRGNESDKAASTRVLPVGQTAVVLDEAYHVLGDGTTELKDLRPMEDRRIDTVNDTDGPLVMTDVSPSIITADTTDGDCEIDLPALANNVGRRIYVINVGAANSVIINAQSGDGIGADGDASITVGTAVTTTILIGHATYWEQVATGGGGTTEYDVITAKYDTGWVANSDWTNFVATITHNLGSSDLIASIEIADDSLGTNRRLMSSGPIQNESVSGDVYIMLMSPTDTAIKLVTGGEGVRVPFDDVDGNATTLTTGTYYYRVVVYAPNKVAAASSVEKYSTGWVANSDWTNAELTVTHGLDTDLSDLIVKFFISTDGTEANAFEILPGENANTTSGVRGIAIYQVSKSQIKVQTGSEGVRYISDVGSGLTIDTQSWYYQVVVYKPTFIARELEVLKYDTGWNSLASWANAEVTISHNLGAPLSDLQVDFFVSSDGTEANARRLELQFRGSVSGTSSNDFFGFTYFAIDDNSFKFQTAQDGVPLIQDNGTFSAVGSGWYYKFVVYKPAILEAASPAEVRAVSGDYTINDRNSSRTINVTTGATDRTITLPDSTATTLIPGDRFRVAKVDSDAGKVTVSRGGTSDTIDGVTSIDVDSQYDYAEVEWTGSFWTLIQYKDHGSGTNNEWQRFADGTLRQYKTNFNVNANPTTVTFEIEFVAVPAFTGTAEGGARVLSMDGASLSTTGVDVRIYNTAGGSYDTSSDAHWEAIGRWRA